MGAAAQALASPQEDCRNGRAFLEPDRQFTVCDEALKAAADAKEKAFFWFKRGEAFYWQEQLGQSLADLNLAIDADPRLVAAYIRRAWVYIQLRGWEDARRDIEFVLTEEPANAEALLVLSYIYTSTEPNSERAYQALQQALDIDPDFHLARLNFAYKQYYYRGDVEAMLREFQTILSHDEAELDKVSFRRKERDVLFAAHVRRERARHLLLAGRDTEAMADVEWLISRHPNMSAAFFMRGQILRNKKDTIEAVKDFGRAIELDPGNVDAKRVRGWSLLNMGRYDEAMVDATELIGGFREQDEGYRLRAEIAKLQGDRKQALQDYEEAFRNNPRFLRIMQERLAGLGYLSRHYSTSYSEEMRNGMMACIVDPEC
jgi:tetratricopeptide (TPR) repeat protein